MQPLLTRFQTTKLTRKEFLTYLGVLILGILGISSFLKLITETNQSFFRNSSKLTRAGFGSGPYGI
ncbi:MAG: hypothetical protein WA152_04670 [Microgenomates group bacterium]